MTYLLAVSTDTVRSDWSPGLGSSSRVADRIAAVRVPHLGPPQPPPRAPNSMLPRGRKLVAVEMQLQALVLVAIESHRDLVD